MTLTPADAAQPRRPVPAQHVLIVSGTERVAPHLIRVHFAGPSVAAYLDAVDAERIGQSDSYAKLYFADPALGLEPPYDMAALRETLSPAEMPTMRTYTLTRIDRAASTLAIDFVTHGDEGVAGPWAMRATAGDALALSGPGGAFTPSSDLETFHLVLGDESAIPAIAEVLAAMPAEARGVAIIEVQDGDDELPLPCPDGVELRWVHRGAHSDATPGVALIDAVRGVAPVSGAVEVFAHGEREAMKALRGILQGEWGVERRAMSLSAYWAYGRNEDAFQAEKREAIGVIFPEG